MLAQLPLHRTTRLDAAQDLFQRIAAIFVFVYLEKIAESLGLGILPPSVTGMAGLFGLLLALDSIGDGSSAIALFKFLESGYRFLLKWAPIFFTPALAKLPLVQESFKFSEIIRASLMIIIGGTIQMALVACLASWLAKNFSSKEERQEKNVKGPSPIVTYPRPGRPYKRRWLPLYAAFMLVALCFARDENESRCAENIFILGGTLLAFVLGNSAPPWLRTVLHPIFTGVLGSWLSIAAWATQAQPAQTFEEVLVKYSSPGGTGPIMSRLLNPLVVALALLLFERRKVLARDRMLILGTATGASVLGLFGTAIVSSSLKLPSVLAVASVSRYCTAPLALAVAESLHASQPLAIAIVVASGFFGVFIVRPLLGLLQIRESRERGLALGAVSHVLGTVTLASWDEAAVPYSALIFVLTSGLTAALAALPMVQTLLHWLLTVN